MTDDPQDTLKTALKADAELGLSPGAPKQNYVKMAVDFGPIIAFFLTFFIFHFLKPADKTEPITVASGVIAGASIIALIVGLAMEKRIAWIPLISAVITIPFALLTVIFKDPMFIKIKMTIVDTLIGAILVGGLVLKKQPLKALLGETLRLKEAAWTNLTIYYALFYFVMAGINEAVWRTQSDSVWATWKLGSIIGGPLLFALCLTPYLMKNMITDDTPDDSAPAA